MRPADKVTDSFRDTFSLCPVCLERIPAKRTVRGDRVYLEKTCADHGDFSVRIWDGDPAFSTWARPKIPKQLSAVRATANTTCPVGCDCGRCPDHRQRSCTIILEVTERCNLACPICYADASGTAGNDPSLSIMEKWFAAARRKSPGSNIQLSGGEPGMRDDLPEIVEMGRKYGFAFIQMNTNGLRLASDPEYVAGLKGSGLASVFLQFDGTQDAIYRKLRGRSLLTEKLAAVQACGENRIGVVLVPTVVPGINDHDIGNILKLAMELSPVVRAVHFQPVSYFGRFFHPPGDSDRMTLPQLMRIIESQSNGAFKASDFHPPGCENSLCSFSAGFMVLPGGKIRPMGSEKSVCCSSPIPALEGAARAINYVARQWRAASETKDGGTDEKPSALNDPTAPPDKMMDLDTFLMQAKTNTLSVSAMAFQDAWNLDLERVRDCCIHVMAPDTRLIPFCLYNLTATNGKRLYRP